MNKRSPSNYGQGFSWGLSFISICNLIDSVYKKKFMLYKTYFMLSGTTRQQQIAKEALDAIHFPFERLTPRTGRGGFQLGWLDLNGPNAVYLEGTHAHAGRHPKEGDAPEKIEGEVDGKRYIFGIMYPYTGDMYIENALVNRPDMAKTTISAELSHVVDYFLPLTDKMRDELTVLAHGGNTTPHGHSWWEKFDYGTEYFTLLGEWFMWAYTLAYTDFDFDGRDFTHKMTKEMAPEVRRILGLQRTDYVPPAPPPVVDPTPAPQPVPEPAPVPPPQPQYEYFPGSTVYHHLSHYPKKDGKIITDTTGLRPCKTCTKYFFNKKPRP